MKKIITLLLSAGIFSASYAQKNHGHNNRDDEYASASYGKYAKGDYDRDSKNNHRNNSYAYQRQIQMDRINHEYNYKVMSIQHNRYMNNRQKRLAIRDAKKERNYRIEMINRNMNGYANNNYGKRYDGRR